MTLTRIDVIGSSSKGNAFLLTTGNSRVLLDAGVSFPKIQKAVDFNLSSIQACFITHEHADHCLGVEKLMDACVPCHMTHGTQRACGFDGSAYRYSFSHDVDGPVKNDSDYMVHAFGVTHDAAEPCGYTFQHKNDDYIVYITDTGLPPRDFQGVTHLIIECNYCDDLLFASEAQHAGRVKSTHLGLNQVKAWLAQQKTARLQEIVLCHLSRHHADRDKIEAEISAIAPIAVKVRIA